MEVTAQQYQNTLYLMETIDRLLAEAKEGKIEVYLPSIKRTVAVDFNVYAGCIHECGSVACLAGWAGLHPKLRAEGFRTKIKMLEVEDAYINQPAFEESPELWSEIFGFDPVYVEDFRGDVPYHIKGDLFAGVNFKLKDNKVCKLLPEEDLRYRKQILRNVIDSMQIV